MNDKEPELPSFTISIGSLTVSGRLMTKEEIAAWDRPPARLRRWWFNDVVLPLRQWRYGIRMARPRGLGRLLHAIPWYPPPS
jgi:hypothetical protein